MFKPNLWDLILIIILVLFACIKLIHPHFANKNTLTCVIKTPKKTIPITLAKDTTLSIEGKIGNSIVEIRASKVRMKFSPCPLKICMHQGWISKPNESIICVPNGIIIKIVSKKSNIDAITW